jgi:hypothetical protein
VEHDLFRTTRNSPSGRVFVALWGGLAVVDVSRPGGGLLAGALVVVLTAACSVGQPPLSAAAVAVTGWLVIDGFVQHQYGELGFAPASWWLLALVLAAVLGVAARTGRRADRR